MTPEHDPVSAGVIRNVTAQGEEVEALRRERDLLSAILDTAAALVVVLDRQGRIVRFNRACETATGYSFEEVRGQALWDLFLIPEEAPPVRAVFEQLQAGQFPNQHENHWLTKDGARRLIAWSNTALQDADGAVQYIVGTGIDITERRQAEAQRDSTLQAVREARDDLELQVAKRTAELQGANRILEDAIAERGRALEAMRESEDHLRSLMNSARRYAIYRIALELSHPYLARVVFASPSLKELLSTSDPYDLTMWFANIHPDDLARCEEANRHSLETGVPFDEQFRVLRPESGEWRWVHVRSTPVFDAAGKLTYFNGLIVDITEQKRTERILQAIAEFEDAVARISGSFINLAPEQVDEGIRRALETIGTAYHVERAYVFQFSGDLSRMECTHEWCARGVEPQIDKLKDLPIDRFGWTVGQVMRSEVIQVRSGSDLPPEASAEWAEFEVLGLQSRIVIPMVYQEAPVGFAGFDSRQTRLWTEQSLKLQVIGDIIVNALEHRRAEQALRESEEKFRGIVELANVGIAIVQDARFRFANQHWASMLGYTVEELLGTEFMPYCTPEERDRIVGYYTRRTRGEPAPTRYETVMLHKDGTRVYAEVSVGMIPYEGRQATFVFLRDITQQKRAQKALEEAYQTLEQRVEERTEELAVLNSIAAVVSGSLDLKEILGAALDKTLDATAMDFGTAYSVEGNGEHTPSAAESSVNGLETASQDLVKEVAEVSRGTKSHLSGADHLQLLAHRGVSASYPQLVRQLPLPWSIALTHLGKPLVWLVDDVIPADTDLRQMLEREGCHQVVTVPLVAKSSLVGAINLGTRTPRAFAPEQLALLAAIGQQVGLAVDNARLYEAQQSRREEAERRRRMAEGLRDILAILNSNRPLGEILDYIVTHASRILGSDATILCRLDRQTQWLTIQAFHGLSAEFVEHMAFQVGRVSIIGEAVLTRRPTTTSNLADRLAHPDIPAEAREMAARFAAIYRTILAVPLLQKEEIYGALAMYFRAERQFTEEEISLAVTFADQAALALENARLREQAEQAAAMQERGRLARELHDSVTQSLYSVTMYTEAAARLMMAGQAAEAAEYLRDARDTAQEALREMRLMIYQLRPPVLEQGGLAVALQVRLDAVERRGGMRAELIVEGEDRLPPAVQAELHQIAQEALNNALKHAHARQVRVHLHFGDDVTVLRLQDDGVGFDPTAVRPGGGLGVPGMRERAQKIGARLDIVSAPGGGTQVIVEVPTGGGG